MADYEGRMAQARASNDQAWACLQERRDDITRIALNGPGPDDETLIQQMAAAVAGRCYLLLGEAYALGLGESDHQSPRGDPPTT
jgi:hypothetical protein